MDKRININSKGREIFLIAKKYRIYIIGGWGINIGSFSILFKDKKTGETVKCKRSTLPIQTFFFKKRAKRIFNIEIPRNSNYEVIFENPESLEVKTLNFLIDLFGDNKPVLNEKIEILIR